MAADVRARPKFVGTGFDWRKHLGLPNRSLTASLENHRHGARVGHIVSTGLRQRREYTKSRKVQSVYITYAKSPKADSFEKPWQFTVFAPSLQKCAKTSKSQTSGAVCRS